MFGGNAAPGKAHMWEISGAKGRLLLGRQAVGQFGTWSASPPKEGDPWRINVQGLTRDPIWGDDERMSIELTVGTSHVTFPRARVVTDHVIEASGEPTERA